MKKVWEYKERAEECRDLARRSKSLEHKDMLLNMAATWDALAESRLKSTASHGRVARIEGVDSGDAA